MYLNRSKYTKSHSVIKVNGQRMIRQYDHLTGDYSVNDNGFLRNDFSELNARNDSYHMALALSRLREFKSQGNLPPNATLEDAVKLIRPRWCQSPAELDRFEVYLMDHALDLYKSLKSETPEDVKEAVGASVKQDTSSGD